MKLQFLLTATFIALTTLYIQEQKFEEIHSSDLDSSNDILEQVQADGEYYQPEINLQLPQPYRYGIVSIRSPKRWCTKDFKDTVVCNRNQFQHASLFRFYKFDNFYLIRSYNGYCARGYTYLVCNKSYDYVMKNENKGKWIIEHHGDYRAIKNIRTGQYLSAQYEADGTKQHLRLFINRNKAKQFEKFKLIEK